MALILGIAGCCIIGWLGAIPALILGVMAKKEIDRDPTQGGRGMAVAGIVLGIIGLVAGLVFLIIIIIWGFAVFAFLADMEAFCEENPDHDLCEETAAAAAPVSLLFAPLLARPAGMAASFRPRAAVWAG